MRETWVFDQYDLVGLLLWVEAGLLSALSILAICAHIIYYNRKFPSRGFPTQNPTTLYIFSLFFADFILGLGATLCFRWLQLGQLNSYNRTFCTAQGVILTLGNLSVVLNNLAITVHSFVVVWWSKTDPASLKWPTIFFIAFIWLYAITMTAIGYSGRLVTSPEQQDIDYDHFQLSTFECSAPKAPSSFQNFGIKNWYWVTLAVSVVVYLVLFLLSRSFISRDNDRWWKVSWIPKGRPLNGNRTSPPQINPAGPKPVTASFFLLYPLVTVILYVQTLVTGLRPAKGFCFQALYTLCGVFDVALFWFFRKGLLEAPPPQRSSDGLAPCWDVGRFFNGRNACAQEA